MLVAAIAFVAADHHKNSGGLTRTVVQTLRSHSYTDVFDVLTNPLSALVAWLTLGIIGVAAAVKYIRSRS